MDDTSEKAHEFCSWLHLQNAKQINRLLTFDIAEFLGFPEADKRWCTPWGKDVTLLTDCSQEQGGFSSTRWTMDGWILDEASMKSLTEEFWLYSTTWLWPPQEFQKPPQPLFLSDTVSSNTPARTPFLRLPLRLD